MWIKKLFQAYKNFMSLEDRIMDVMLNKECRFCGKLTAKKIQNSIPNQNTYYCSYCRHTYTMVNGDQMGKRKNKKNKKTTTSVAAANQKVINNTTFNDPNDSWEVEIDCVDSCSKAPDKINIWFFPLAKRKVDVLMKEYTNIEWLAYLLGERGSREVADIFIPEQTISTVKVDDVECDEYNNLSVIGVIHSHHTMGNTFSQTDHDWINQNHNISLCVSTNGIAGQFRYKTECGAFKIIDVNVRLKFDFDFNDEEFIESIKDKLSKKTYTSYTYNGYEGSYWDKSSPGQGAAYPYGYGGQANLPAEIETEAETEAGTEAGTEADDTLNGFLTEEERIQLEVEVEELDFSKELSLAEELDILDEMNVSEDKEDN